MSDIKKTASEMTDQEMREIPFSKETVYHGKVVHLECWQVTCPNGKPALREVIVHVGAAAIVPVFEDGTTLLVRQHRVPVDRITYELPAGKLDSPDEDPLECAVRELQEETGYTAGRMTLLTSLLTTPAFCTEKIGIFMAQDLTPGETDFDEDEFLKPVRLPLEEAAEMVMRGEIRDGKTVCGILMAREALRRQKEQA